MAKAGDRPFDPNGPDARMEARAGLMLSLRTKISADLGLLRDSSVSLVRRRVIKEHC